MGGVAGSLLSGVISDRLCGGKRILVAAPASLLAGILLLGYGATASPQWPELDLVMLLLIGGVIACPDSFLGGVATTDLCHRAGMATAMTAACGITNGLGSIGAVLQGPLSSWVSETYGWGGLWQLLGAGCICAAAVLAPLALQDWRSLRSDRPR